MRKVLSAVIFCAIGVFLMAWAWYDARPRPVVIQVPDTSGHEEPQPGCLHENGYVICNYGGAEIADAYQRYEPFLGEPVSAFDGHCQSFRFGKLCYQPGGPPDWQIEFANLGLDDLQMQGCSPKPGSSPHPAVRDWLVNQLEAGADLTRLVGRIVSEPVCDRATGQCRQWADKVVFVFQSDALTWDQVQRAPLGLWLTHARTRPMAVTAEDDRQPNVVALIAGVAFVLAGLATLRKRAGHSASQPL